RRRAPRDPPHAEPRDRQHLRGHPRHPHPDRRPGHHWPRRLRPMSPTSRILVVDDDRDVRETVVEFLRGEGFDVVEAANGLEALRAETVVVPAGAPPASPPAARRAAPGPTAPADILVVGGDAELRVKLEGLLTAAGHRVRLTGDAASGVRAIVAQAPHVVLLAVEMAGLSGVGVLPTVVALAPDAKVIMVNERANAELARRSLAFGAFECVTKPIDSSHLLQAIEAALALRRVDLGE